MDGRTTQGMKQRKEARRHIIGRLHELEGPERDTKLMEEGSVLPVQWPSVYRANG